MNPKKQQPFPHNPTTPTTKFCPLTTLVRSISTLHTSFHSPHHFPKFLLSFMTFSGVAGYYSMGYWYESSLRERSEFYRAVYENGHDGAIGNEEVKRREVKRQRTIRDGHYEGRKRLFDTSVKLTPYQVQLRQHTTQSKTVEEKVVTVVASHSPAVDLQRQVTKFW